MMICKGGRESLFCWLLRSRQKFSLMEGKVTLRPRHSDRAQLLHMDNNPNRSRNYVFLLLLLSQERNFFRSNLRSRPDDSLVSLSQPAQANQEERLQDVS